MAERLDITQDEAAQLLEKTTGLLSEAFSRQQSVTFSKLGSFHVKKSEGRKAYSPVLDKHFLTPPRRVLEFQPGDTLKEKTRNIRHE
jgi:nucleoid DNA-binding protein